MTHLARGIRGPADRYASPLVVTPCDYCPSMTNVWDRDTIAHMTTHSGTSRVDERGRLVLPAAVRRRLELRPGDDVIVSEEPDGSVRVRSRRRAAQSLIGLADRIDHSAVDDLREERNSETRDEDRSSQRADR